MWRSNAQVKKKDYKFGIFSAAVADYLSCETNLDALNNVQQENIMQKWDSSELSLTVQSSYDFSKNDSNDGVDKRLIASTFYPYPQRV